MLCWSIFPKIFKIIVGSGIGHKDMYHHIRIIHCNPQRVFSANDAHRFLTCVFAYHIFY